MSRAMASWRPGWAFSAARALSMTDWWYEYSPWMSLLVEGNPLSRMKSGTYVGEVPGRRKSALSIRIPKDLGAGDCLHSDNVETRSAELVQGLDRVGLWANRANLVVRNWILVSMFLVCWFPQVAQTPELFLRWMCGGSSWRAGRRCRAGQASQCGLPGRGGRER